MKNHIRRLAVGTAAVGVSASSAMALLLGIGNLRAAEQHQIDLEARWLLGIVDYRIQNDLPIDSTFLYSLGMKETWVSIRSNDLDLSWSMDGGTGEFSSTAVEGDLAVTVGHTDEELQQEIARASGTAFAIAFIVIGVVWFLAKIWATDMQRALDGLVSAAKSIGSGDSRPRREQLGVVELDEVADVLEESAVRIEQLLHVERQLVAETSHQLRTPITALSLQLEELQTVADDPEQVKSVVQAARRQVQRITSTMEELISARRGISQESGGLLVDEIRPVIDEVRQSLEAEDRLLEVDLPPEAKSTAAPGAIRHILSILLENALQHGSGTVSLEAMETGDWVVICVRDQGKGLSVEAASVFQSIDQGSRQPLRPSIGLPLAISLAASQHGRLDWRESEPAIVRVYLPAGE